MHTLNYLFAFLALSLLACTGDALPEPSETDCLMEESPTYVDDVQIIIERSCAYSGCHLGGAPGVYDDYEGLLDNLESGLFRERVITLREDPTIGMPPEYAPESRPRSLTDEELNLIACWLDGGFPQD